MKVKPWLITITVCLTVARSLAGAATTGTAPKAQMTNPV